MGKQILVSPILSLDENRAQFCDARYRTEWPRHKQGLGLADLCIWRIFPACDFSLSAPKQVKALLSILHWQGLQRGLWAVCWGMGGTGSSAVRKRKCSWPHSRRDGCIAQQLLLGVSGAWEVVLELLFSMELWSWGALSDYELLLRWAFLEWSLVAAVKSNFSIERHRVFRTWLPAVISFIERPFCWVLLIGYFLFTRESSCHDIQCFVGLFSRRDYLLYQLNHLLWCWMLVTKSMLTNEYAVSFWREPTEGSLLFRLVFSIFIYQT